MADVNIDDIVHLVHGELTTAVANTTSFLDAPLVEISTIKVRMGQQMTSDGAHTLQLDPAKYPLSNNGWQLEITYDAKSPANRSHIDKLTESGIPAYDSYEFLSELSISHMTQSVAQHRNLLKKRSITTITQLSESEPILIKQLAKTLSPTNIRNAQTLARLALTIPDVNVPEDLLSLKLVQFLDAFPSFNKADYDHYQWNTLEVIYEWLQQLELCLDSQFFTSLTFNKLLLKG